MGEIPETLPPPTVNETLVDEVFLRASLVERYTQGQIDQALAVLEAQLYERIIARVGAALPRIRSRGSRASARDLVERTKLSGRLRKNQKLAKRHLLNLMAHELRQFAKDEARWQLSVLQGAIPDAVELSFKRPAPALLREIATRHKFQGRRLADWVENLTKSALDAVEIQIDQGLVNGETIEEIVARLRGTRAAKYRDGVISTSKRAAERLVRTAVTHTQAQAREATFRENADLIERVKWVSTLDFRTSQICMALDGQVFPVGEGPRPPAHPNCRSATVPIVKSLADLGFGDFDAGTRASMDGQVPADITYEKWLRGQPAAVQDEILGRGKGALFRRGVVPLRRWIDTKNRALTLRELEALEAKLRGGGKAAKSSASAKAAAERAKAKAAKAKAAKEKAEREAAAKAKAEAAARAKAKAEAEARAKAAAEKAAAEAKAKAEAEARAKAAAEKAAAEAKAKAEAEAKARAEAARKAAEEAAAKKKSEAAQKAAATRAAKKAAREARTLDTSEFRQVGPQAGSQPGGLFEDPATGERWYLKETKSLDHARNEALAASLYRAGGVEAPEVFLTTRNGKPGVASKIIDGVERNRSAVLSSHKAAAARDFAFDAWLANWDVVGASYDNLLVRGSGVVRVDMGGALRYRAQGSPKPNFGASATEWDSLRQASTAPQASAVFGPTSHSELAASARRVRAVTEAEIRRQVDLYYTGAEATELKKLLVARRRDILERGKAAATAAKAEAKALRARKRGGVWEVEGSKEDYERAWKAWRASGGISDAQRVAISRYTGSSYQNFRAAQGVRAKNYGVGYTRGSPADRADFERAAREIESFIAAGPRRRQDLVRGFGLPRDLANELVRAARVEKEWIAEAITSTADRPTPGFVGGGDVSFRFFFKGTRQAVWVKPISSVPGEDEWIVGQGSRFRVLRIEERDVFGRRTFDITLEDF